MPTSASIAIADQPESVETLRAALLAEWPTISTRRVDNGRCCQAVLLSAVAEAVWIFASRCSWTNSKPTPIHLWNGRMPEINVAAKALIAALEAQFVNGKGH